MSNMISEWCSSMCTSCCDSCTQFCTAVYKCCCCECLRDNPEEKYPHIEYKQVGSDEDEEIGEVQIPTKRRYSYKYSQSHTEFEIHPQVLESGTDDNHTVITDQPKSSPARKHHKRTVSDIPEEVTTSDVPAYQSQSSCDPSMYDSQDDLDMGSQIGYSVHSSPSTPLTTGEFNENFRTPIAGRRTYSSPFLSRTSSGNKPLDQGGELLHQEYRAHTLERDKKAGELLHQEYRAHTLERDKKAGELLHQEYRAHTIERDKNIKHVVAKSPLAGERFMRARAATLATPEVSRTVQCALAHSRSKEELHTSVLFALYYDEHHSTLIVHLYMIYRLQTRRAIENCNPFVEVYLLPRKHIVHESRVEKETVTPKYDQVFKFTKVSPVDISNQTLIFRVYNNDKSNFLGGVLYPLRGANYYGDPTKARVAQVNEEEFLQENSEGEILITLCYQPKEDILELTVLEATNLQQKRDILGPANSYVKVYLLHHKSRHTKWKTSIQKKTNLPVFNESCQFNIANMSVSELSMDIVLLDYDRFSRNNAVGLVQLGSNVPCRSAREHWTKVIEKPGEEMSYWHSIVAVETQKSGSMALQMCVGTPPRMQS